MTVERDQEKIAAMLAQDPRYGWEAYQFVQDALQHTQDLLGRRVPGDAEPGDEHHLTARELCEGLGHLGAERYGPLAGAVLSNSGIETTEDIGEIVWNMVNCGFLLKSERDRKEDFQDLFNLRELFLHVDLVPEGGDEFRSVIRLGPRWGERS